MKNQLDEQAAMRKLEAAFQEQAKDYTANGIPEVERIQIPGNHGNAGQVISHRYAQDLLDYEAAVGRLPGFTDPMESAQVVGHLRKLTEGQAIEFVAPA